MAEKIESISGLPVIGETYKVQFVTLKICETHNADLKIPVLGRANEDGDMLQFATLHYHLDARFVDADLIDTVKHISCGLSPIFFIERSKHSAIVIGAEVVYRGLSEFKCVKQMPDFPSNRLAMQLYPHFKNHLLRKRGDCLRCPHKGTSLNGILPQNGVLTCPSHGLKFADSKVLPPILVNDEDR